MNWNGLVGVTNEFTSYILKILLKYKFSAKDVEKFSYFLTIILSGKWWREKNLKNIEIGCVDGDNNFRYILLVAFFFLPGAISYIIYLPVDIYIFFKEANNSPNRALAPENYIHFRFLRLYKCDKDGKLSWLAEENLDKDIVLRKKKIRKDITYSCEGFWWRLQYVRLKMIKENLPVT